jgi:hypothetical protein
MTKAFIAIRGNFFDRADEIFKTFRYVGSRQDLKFDDWQTFTDYLFDKYLDFADRDIAIRGIWTSDGWTIINDPEMVDTVDEEVLIQLSQKLRTEIVTFIIQTTSNSFGFTVYNDTIKRNFFVSEGEITDNLFEPIEQEKGLNINEGIFSEDILKLAEKLGIDLEGKKKSNYSVKHLEYNEEMKSEIQRFKQKQAKQENKPWWKFW